MDFVRGGGGGGVLWTHPSVVEFHATSYTCSYEVSKRRHGSKATRESQKLKHKLKRETKVGVVPGCHRLNVWQLLLCVCTTGCHKGAEEGRCIPGQGKAQGDLALVRVDEAIGLVIHSVSSLHCVGMLKGTKRHASSCTSCRPSNMKPRWRG